MSFWTPFHREWGKAKDASGYDATHWERMRTIMHSLEAELDRLRNRNSLVEFSDRELSDEVLRRMLGKAQPDGR